MSTDLTQFYQVFFEETTELLAEQENLLLGLDLDAPDPEQLNAVFRAAHSIKGGASAFGFTDMTDVTHLVESLLDRVRAGEMKLTRLMVDAFLSAADVLKVQLDGHRGVASPDPAAAAVVCATLGRLAEQGARVVPPAAHAMQSAAAADPGARTFTIQFGLKSQSANSAVLDNLLADLGSRGQLDVVRRPHATHGGEFVLRLTTSAREADIWEALAFVVDPAALAIEIDSDAEPKNAPGELQVDDSGFLNSLFETLVNPQHAPPRAEGRRESDDPVVDSVPSGRRTSDKVAVSASVDATSIRVNIDKVDQLINLVGELVITQAMLAQTTSTLDPAVREVLAKRMGQLERNTRDLQEAVMAIRMMPINFVFSRFGRVARDLANKLGKEVELKMVGEATELDKGLIEKIADPLNHLVRNSLDHGIELPAKRVAAGKPAQGTITLRAFHRGGSVVVEVADDGAGLNRERILEKAKERGLPVHEAMSDGEVWQLIFEPGFSTAEIVTDVSGRGVGMDVVRRNIHSLNGSIDIQSTAGQGTQISIRLPLTLAILDGLSVAVGSQVYIVPLTGIVECFQPRREDIKAVSGAPKLVCVRGDYLPIVSLHEYFGVASASEPMESGILIIMESDGVRKAAFVDGLLGQHQVVIKSLESNYRRVDGISGATVMGDGRVALILDVSAIVRETHERRLAA